MALLCICSSFSNIVLSVNDLASTCVLLSWDSEGFKEFCAGETLDQFFFQCSVFFKNLELIIKKNLRCGILLFSLEGY